MTERTDQRICINFCFNLGKSCTQTIEMIKKAFVDESMGITHIKKWYRRFKNGRTSVDIDPRSGRLSLTTTPENIERVRLAIKGDRRLTVRELKNDLGIPKTTVWEIFNNILGMTRVCAKFIPKLLTTEQKDLRSEIAQDNLEMVSDDENVLRKVITGDESWVYGYDPETKQQLSQWKHPDEPRSKKARQSRSHVKSMLIIIFDCEGVVHYEFAPRGQKINKEYNVEVLKTLRDAVRKKRPRFWSSGNWLLHHDNAPAHLSNLEQQIWRNTGLYSFASLRTFPTLGCDFWMFLKLKMTLKGKRFDDIETIQSNATRELKAISKSAFKDCFKM